MKSFHHRPYLIGLVALVALGLALPMAAGAQGEVPQGTIQANSGQDYAATELGNSWDMNSPSDIAFEYTRNNGQMSNLRFEDGRLKATASGNDPRVTLVVPSNPNVNPVLPEGGYRPIDAASYRYLTVKIAVSKATFGMVFWQNGQGQPYEHTGFKQLNAGENVVTFDLAAGGKDSEGAWDGSVQGLYFDPAVEANISFEIDYVRLSTTTPSDPNNTPPEVNITSPSYISGPDYATTELGNPWDMNDGSDISQFFNITGVSYNNGILRGVNTSGDPALMLKVNGAINTSKYKYLTYRFSVDGNIDTNAGSVARFIWWSDIPERSTVSRDIVVYEGFRNVSFDLRTIRTEPNGGANIAWAQSAPTVFRFDPHEFPTQRAFNLDYVMLTGDSTANEAFDIRYTASDGDGGSPQVQLFYDTDRNAGNGTTAISCGGSNNQNGLQARFFLPLMVGRSAAPESPSGASCRWNTANVPNGTYYVYAVANDGTDSVGRYSQTPVVVQH